MHSVQCALLQPLNFIYNFVICSDLPQKTFLCNVINVWSLGCIRYQDVSEWIYGKYIIQKHILYNLNEKFKFLCNWINVWSLGCIRNQDVSEWIYGKYISFRSTHSAILMKNKQINSNKCIMNMSILFNCNILNKNISYLAC